MSRLSSDKSLGPNLAPLILFFVPLTNGDASATVDGSGRHMRMDE